MTEGTDHHGGCLCGAARFVATGPPARVTICHCGQCRRATGAAFGAFAIFATEAVTYTEGAPTWYRSSETAQRGFCASCGSTLAFQYDKRPDFLALALGAMDDPSALRPERHIWTSSKVAWLKLDDGLPQYGESWDGRKETEI